MSNLNILTLHVIDIRSQNLATQDISIDAPPPPFFPANIARCIYWYFIKLYKLAVQYFHKPPQL